MSEISIDDRGRALEDSFFRDRDKRLVAEMKAAKDKKRALEDLKLVSGIRDDAVIEQLWEMKVSPESIGSLSIVPLVLVAWADGVVSKKEREAIQQSAVAVGITKGSTAEQLLTHWLTNPPAENLFDTWESYTKALCKGIDPKARTALCSEVMDRARKVAESTGGLLGLVSKVSSEEEYVLAKLKKAFA